MQGLEPNPSPLAGPALPCPAGLGGICPGPGLVALASLQPKLGAFVAAMLAGMKLDHALGSASISLQGGKQVA